MLGRRRQWAACRLTGAAPVGYGEPVAGAIEQLELDAEGPVAWLRDAYRSVDDLPGQG